MSELGPFRSIIRLITTQETRKVDIMNKLLNAFKGMIGSQKNRHMKTARYKLLGLGVALMGLGVASPVFAGFGSDVTLKLGGGGLHNNTLSTRQAIVGQRQGGGHISIDYNIPDRAFGVSPFLNIYHRVQTDASGTRPRNDKATNIIGGMNVLFTAFNSDRAHVYMGIGGGIAHMKVVSGGTAPATTTTYKNKLMADLLVGLEMKVAQSISLFIEPQYVRVPDMASGLAVHAGLAFHLSKLRKSPIVQPMPVVITVPEPVKKPEPVKVVEPVKVSSVEALATMHEMVHFKSDRSDLSDLAKGILNDKVAVFKANPTMRITIVGFASQPGTAKYNMALGLRRAKSAKTYLVSMGVNPNQIEIATQGEGMLAVDDPGKAENATNRRNQFRLLIADQFLEAPK